MQIENFKCKGGSGWKRARLVNACESQASIYIYIKLRTHLWWYVWELINEHRMRNWGQNEQQNHHPLHRPRTPHDLTTRRKTRETRCPSSVACSSRSSASVQLRRAWTETVFVFVQSTTQHIWQGFMNGPASLLVINKYIQKLVKK